MQAEQKGVVDRVLSHLIGKRRFIGSFSGVGVAK